MFEHCMFCNDIKKFNSKLNTIRNINNRIEGYLHRSKDTIKSIRDFSEDDMDFYNKIRNDHSHTHFMCGQCYKADTHLLKNEEDKMHKLIVNLKNAYEKEDISKQVLYNVSVLVQGHYNMTCREINRILNN